MAASFADTSFLFSLYGNDVHTERAEAWARKIGRPITVTVLNRYELGNAVRFAAFRKVIAEADALSSLSAFEGDLLTGHLHPVSEDFPAIIEEARRLSGLYTMRGGHRSFDMLHVAAAKVFRAGMFLSFDAGQRKLAVAAGLATGP